MNKGLHAVRDIQAVYGSEKITFPETEELAYFLYPNMFLHGDRHDIIEETFNKFNRVFLVIDRNMDRNKIDSVLQYFSGKVTHDSTYFVEGGESAKDMQEVLRILDWLDNGGFVRRSDVVVIVGGGSVLDLASFASSIYRRGVDHVRVPTTLLGLVDAGIGVKSAINYNGNKNRVGSYQRPKLSIIDPGLIDRFDTNQIKYGICEIIKAAVIGSRELFDMLYSNRHKLGDPDFYTSACGASIVKKSIEVLLREIAINPNELTLQRTMDFGHIMSPVLETESGYEVPHGLAVIKEVVFCCRYSVRQGHLPVEEMALIEELLIALNLEYEEPSFMDKDFMREAVEQAVRHREGKLYLPVPYAIGKPYFVEDVDRFMGFV